MLACAHITEVISSDCPRCSDATGKVSVGNVWICSSRPAHSCLQLRRATVTGLQNQMAAFVPCIIPPIQAETGAKQRKRPSVCCVFVTVNIKILKREKKTLR